MSTPFARPSEHRCRASFDLRSEQERLCRSPRFRGISLALAFSRTGFPACHREGDRIEAEEGEMVVSFMVPVLHDPDRPAAESRHPPRR